MTALNCHNSQNNLNFLNFKTWICSIYSVVLYDIIYIFESLKLTDFFLALHPKPIDFLHVWRVKNNLITSTSQVMTHALTALRLLVRYRTGTTVPYRYPTCIDSTIRIAIYHNTHCPLAHVRTGYYSNTRYLLRKKLM